MKHILLITILASLLVSCANLQIGSPIPSTAVDEIRAGFTTKDQIKRIFGGPLRTVTGENGEIWVYKYINCKNGFDSVKGMVDSKKKEKFVCDEVIISFTGNIVSNYSKN